MRIALGIEYEGTHFCGWQSQPQLRTVQTCLEEALSQVAAHPVSVICAGRTDTGVHATGQVVHFDTEVVRSPRAWMLGTNSHLPSDICVRWAKPVTDEFHARYKAIARRYRYLIFNEPIRTAILRFGVTWHYKTLDEALMHEAGQALVGTYDFTSFRALECQASTAMRTLYHLSVVRRGDLIVIEVSANAFLHHMVRNIVGVLMTIGTGTKPVQWAREVLEAKNRTLGGVTAPPYGLYLVSVSYPVEYELPIQPLGPFFI